MSLFDQVGYIVVNGETLITAEEFYTTYNISNNYLSIMKRHNSDIVTTIGGRLFFNKTQYERRVAFRNKIILKAQQNYFTLTEHISETKLSKLLHRYLPRGSYRTWLQMMRGRLFYVIDSEETPFKYKLSQSIWEFYRFTTFLIRRIERNEVDRELRIKKGCPNYNKWDKIYRDRLINYKGAMR